MIRITRSRAAGSARAPIKVLISRDRLGCGGGIHAYFEAVVLHLAARTHICGVGRSHAFYGGRSSGGRLSTGLRVIVDWLNLAIRIVVYRSDIVHLNVGIDKEERSLMRDAVSLWITRILGRSVLVFWHGWDHPAQGTADFPGGNQGWLCRSYRKAVSHSHQLKAQSA